MLKNLSVRVKTLILVLLLIVTLSGSALIVQRISEDLAPEQSSALFGGELEFGYPFAGYMIAYGENGGASICSMTYLTPRIGVTAAHCTNPGSTILAGESAFSSNTADNTQASAYHTKPGWDFKTSNNDFSVVELDANSIGVREYAKVGTPGLGCNYKIVAYGRTEDEASVSLRNRLRKSATVCITNIEQDLFYVKASGGGICFGDSGSAIYEKDTNKVVGLVSAIIAGGFGQSAKCAYDNQAAVIRADNNLGFISQYISDVASVIDPSAISCLDNRCSNIITNTPEPTDLALLDQFASSQNNVTNVVSQFVGRPLTDQTALIVVVFVVSIILLAIFLLYSMFMSNRRNVLGASGLEFGTPTIIPSQPTNTPAPTASTAVQPTALQQAQAELEYQKALQQSKGTI